LTILNNVATELILVLRKWSLIIHYTSWHGSNIRVAKRYILWIQKRWCLDHEASLQGTYTSETDDAEPMRKPKEMQVSSRLSPLIIFIVREYEPCKWQTLAGKCKIHSSDWSHYLASTIKLDPVIQTRDLSNAISNQIVNNSKEMRKETGWDSLSSICCNHS
jgi:hypothetical protein